MCLVVYVVFLCYALICLYVCLFVGFFVCLSIVYAFMCSRFKDVPELRLDTLGVQPRFKDVAVENLSLEPPEPREEPDKIQLQPQLKDVPELRLATFGDGFELTVLGGKNGELD